MTSQTYLQIDKYRDEVEAIKAAETQAELETNASEKWLKLKEECEERYKRLGKWVADEIDDLPF